MIGPAEKWKTFYQKPKISWLEPDQVTPAYIKRWTQSEWTVRFMLAARLKPDKQIRILEAGCGTGIYSLALSMLGFSIDAFDYNEEALAIARQLQAKIKKEGCELPVRFYQDNLLNIQSSPHTYDFVFNQAVLEYFCDDQERNQALKEMVRVTKHGGKVAVIVQHTGHPFRPYWEKMGWPGYIDQPAVIRYTPAKLRRELEEAGLKNVTVDGIYPWKALFFWPKGYQKWKWTNEIIYLLGQGLTRFFPLPRVLRANLATQILAVGCKS